MNGRGGGSPTSARIRATPAIAVCALTAAFLLGVFFAQDERAFRQGRWQFESAPEWRSLHYVTGGQFYATGASIQTEPVDDSD